MEFLIQLLLVFINIFITKVLQKNNDKLPIHINLFIKKSFDL